MRINQISKLFSIIVIFIFIFAACAVNPVTGKKELMLFSEKSEIAMGQQTDQEIRQEYGIYEDQRLNAYVTTIGMKLVPHTHRPNLQYHFAVLDTPVENAFAAPGGYIYVTRGILALMNSEAELAAVVGHELGHVSARHSVKKLSEIMLVYAGLAIGSALSKDVAKFAGVAGLGAQLLFLKFSRDDEYQADELGVRYSRASGYDPRQMAQFFDALEKLSSEMGGGHIPNFLSTHPLTSKRINRVREMTVVGDAVLAVRRPEYLGSINNVVYGEDPRQGYVESNAFYHPEMAVTFDIPSEWTVVNTPQQVTLTSKDEKAAMILRAEPSAMAIDQYLNKRAAELNSPQLLGSRQTVINGLTGINALYRVLQEQQPLKVGLTCIRKDSNVFTFFAASGEGDFNNYNYAFSQTINSFRRLSDPRFTNRQAKRLHVINANGGERLRDLLSRTGVDQKLWKRLAIANDLEIDAALGRGQAVKIIR